MYSVCNYLIIEYEYPEIAHIGIHSARRQPAQDNNLSSTPYIHCPCQEHTGALRYLLQIWFFILFLSIFFCPTLAYATIHVIGPPGKTHSFPSLVFPVVTPCLTHSTIFPNLRACRFFLPFFFFFFSFLDNFRTVPAFLFLSSSCINQLLSNQLSIIYLHIHTYVFSCWNTCNYIVCMLLSFTYKYTYTYFVRSTSTLSIFTYFFIPCPNAGLIYCIRRKA